MIRVRKGDVPIIKTIDYQHNYSGVNLTASSMIDLSRLAIDLRTKLDLQDRQGREWNNSAIDANKRSFRDHQ